MFCYLPTFFQYIFDPVFDFVNPEVVGSIWSKLVRIGEFQFLMKNVANAVCIYVKNLFSTNTDGWYISSRSGYAEIAWRVVEPL